MLYYNTHVRKYLLTKCTKYDTIELCKTHKEVNFMWSEMSYNQFKLTFSERLEIIPDFDEYVFSYYFSERVAATEYVEKVTKGDLDWV